MISAPNGSVAPISTRGSSPEECERERQEVTLVGFPQPSHEARKLQLPHWFPVYGSLRHRIPLRLTRELLDGLRKSFRR